MVTISLTVGKSFILSLQCDGNFQYSEVKGIFSYFENQDVLLADSLYIDKSTANTVV